MGRQKENNLEGVSPFPASETLVYALDAEDFSHRSWLAGINTKKKGSGHKLKFLANDVKILQSVNSTFYITLWELSPQSWNDKTHRTLGKIQLFSQF